MKGRDAEQMAADYLMRQGLVLRERNYRCRFGEIDLIMSDAGRLVFVEVRMRTSEAFGGAAGSITFTKKNRLLRAARHYLSSRLDTEPACRFDVVLITGARNPVINWIRNAFGES
ncbi:putative endonuclease [Nitrosomonas marina]|uniref:UPF0102 protein SAMN05216326_101149 n=1 Tax=Nitrosomonas marina TaxID=917 RepID=A0A1H9Y9I8_9PROT|nr:YraN family protein [Nitrosomonas marina]SES65443.1 putative endonuclease [Nitrosomonas marina]